MRRSRLVSGPVVVATVCRRVSGGVVAHGWNIITVHAVLLGSGGWEYWVRCWVLGAQAPDTSVGDRHRLMVVVSVVVSRVCL